jgi:hypothetical protein
MYVWGLDMTAVVVGKCWNRDGASTEKPLAKLVRRDNPRRKIEVAEAE